jgi:trimethylamine--corrinoid protein Co-methyltransferase
MIAMAAAAVGGLQHLREKPIMIFPSGTIEPLVHHEDGIAKALACAKHGVPFVYMASGNLVGSATPVTMAGALIQGNASTLAGWTIIQNAYPGSKIIGGGVCPAFDMQYGTYTFGSPEFSLSGAAKADLCRFYNVPGFGFAGGSDAKVLDAQAGLEYALSLYSTAAAGMSLIHDSGYLDGGATNSFESVLFADEVISMVKHVLRPIEFNDNTMALDVIAEVGPGGTYLTHEHTLANFKTHLWQPRYLFRGRYDDWVKMGAQDLHTRLNTEVKSILASHTVEPLPEPVLQEIKKIVAAHAK